MAVRINRLELSGFKSFPRSTVFEFDTGITAIIGPNGSGKSNIADAMRWVLGEQSYANLRGRKAEDVIFSGSSSRSALGMAEVTLTLDNSERELPIDFQEVSITRRAFRSGENHYLINGARVRLKDVSQITASLGQSHTVIGQGLVDAALSQRPEERRGLFEHAAGITGLRIKYAATERHLNEAESNSQRLEDLLNELEPRLRTLERQAKQAREYADVKRDLRQAALLYYGNLWKDHLCELSRLESMVASTSTELEDIEMELNRERLSFQELDERRRATLDETRALELETREVEDRLREARHQCEMLEQRYEAQKREVDRLSRDNDALQQEASELTGRIENRSAERRELASRLAEIEIELSGKRAERDRTRQQIEMLQKQRSELLEQRGRLVQEQYRLQAQVEQRSQTIDEMERHTPGLEQQRQSLLNVIDQLDQELVAIEHTRSERQEQQETEQRRYAKLETDLQREQQELNELQQELTRIDAEHAQVSARYDALRRLRESGDGLHRGVQAVLEGSKRGELSGVVGTLAQQIDVPDWLETAIEAALGGHIQDVVVERWADAERAIEHLKRMNAGRATFQPLDTVRSTGQRERITAGDTDGVHGVACDLIAFDSSLEPVMRGILGRVVITDDLRATREVLKALRPGWTAVTVEGEVTRSGGSVTGGSRVRASGSLGRERELRELPGRLRGIESERTAVTDRMSAASASISSLQEELEVSRRALSEIQRDRDRLERERQSLQDQRERSSQDLDALSDREREIQREIETSRAQLEELHRESQALEERISRTGGSLVSLEGDIVEIESAADDATLRSLETEYERLRERAQSMERDQSELSRRLESIASERSRQESARLNAVNQIDSMESELAALRAESDELEKNLYELQSRLDPMSGRRDELDQQRSIVRSRINELEQHQRTLERQRDRQGFEVQRQEAHGELLLERADDVLESDGVREVLEAQTGDAEFDEVSAERSLHRLRQRVRRISAFGEETITEYEQEQERFSFLRQQLDDVQRGAESLRALLADLDRSMSLEFDRTFGKVAQAFEVTFSRLFGGGSAKLTRTDAEDGKAGIDIVAQPPGKRLQSLALLSGGERALTAAALLFAILRVNPSPFCLLDEVDAALDESNVVRFRDEVRDLSRKTQFVIVTHNRATIEGADVLYGITMGDDAVSRVVSLRLPAEAVVT